MPVNPSSTDLKLIEAWKDRDARARSLIQRTISGPMVAMTRALKTSSEMWLLLHDLNDLNTSDHRATINRRLANLFLEESGDMTEHLNTYIEMVAEAEAAGLPWGKQDEDKALCFLDTLDHAFRPIKSEWRGLPKEERTFFALIKIYKEEDVARKRSSDRQTEAAAMAAVHKPKQSVKIKGVSGNKSKKAGHRSNHLKAAKTSGSGNGPLCFGCGSRDGHIRADCPVAKHLGPGGIICWNCHKKGHSQTECPNNHAKAVYTKDEDILSALVEEHAMLVGESGPATVAFMVDSGASQHIVENEWMLSNSRNIPEMDNSIYRAPGAVP
ncbi:unnamed protein product [Tilletia laevis]|uniref:CCHC-type domain-containing protein n=1 Tax=Tilletia caries TaxID=13290 RepID=A0A177SWT8_9BASI|nr:hypothetical protein CF335_g5601 [Tilletia laevis]KAE8236393.1 hypothetical protein A4X03_0g9451 [Tilletia caries]CAD6885960.1 unnamed protein product [Tilletia caries]CAD6899145.1 unnamed protein product [Tilletia caries]CAD6906911.1 unnamed protein product [Tilletia laevis]